ncbi:MAG: hypothetical protein LBB74_02690 [Chitinispirillales bacterium]|jgi:predicted helicase|nr:hypothetical protein [Chitinispirillales bacterium]
MNKAEIFYKDIGDCLSREEKLRLVKEAKSALNPEFLAGMGRIEPNEHGDWVNMRSSGFGGLIPVAPEKKFDLKTQSFFVVNAIGVATNRDIWVYNFSENSLKNNMKTMVDFYNEQRKTIESKREKDHNVNIDDYIDTDYQKINWTVNLKKDIENNVAHKFDENVIKTGLYRPFTRMNLFFDTNFIERPGIWSKLSPTEDNDNLFICLTGIGVNKEFSAIITNVLPDLQLIANGQCFPLYHYDKKPIIPTNLFEDVSADYVRRDAVSDFILSQSQSRYGPMVTKEDIFYYVYGLLHSPDYRTVFAGDLKKMLPRLPLLEKPADFWAFSKAGRELADLHLNYEDVPAPDDVLINGKPASKASFSAGALRVQKMKFPEKGKKDTIVYNPYITVSNIPPAAYDYVVNGKSAIEWVMERYAVTTHKDSGITNDPNDWAEEHENPRYILDLLLSVIGVSVKTVALVAGLPGLAL